MRSRLAFIPGGLPLVVTLVAACVAFAPAGNDPVPLPADLAGSVEALLGIRLSPADRSVPPVSATEALEIAGEGLLSELDSNNVPRQDPSVPHGLVRRLVSGGLPGPPTSAWLVVYRWAAGFNCDNPGGGPGPCKVTSFYVIDDRTGEVIASASESSSAAR